MTRPRSAWDSLADSFGEPLPWPPRPAAEPAAPEPAGPQRGPRRCPQRTPRKRVLEGPRARRPLRSGQHPRGLHTLHVERVQGHTDEKESEL
jgi:hypothetical protein